MPKKIFLIIILANFCLFVWQIVLSITLSTQGDILSDYQHRIDVLKNQSDTLEFQLAENSSLLKISQRASVLGYVQAKIYRLGSVKLADAKLK